MNLAAHPYANIFPMASQEDFERLAFDITANGLVEPITLYQGKILDGRNRYRALVELGVEIEPSNVIEFDGDDAAALAFVISKNLARRHLDESQRAMVAARLANIEHGQRADYSRAANLPVCSQSQAAQRTKVSERSVRSARKVLDSGDAALAAAVDAGAVAVSVAAKIADLSPEDRKQALADARPDHAVKKIVRRNKEQELATKQCALPERKFGVILADPEWRFEPYSRETGMDRAADNHYPTSTTDDICARDVASIAADDCVLFLWSTAPMLADTLRVMEAWGFKYVSRCVWDKQSLGHGYWFRDACEILLVGKRGSVPAPAPGDQWPSLISAPATDHSAKPEIFAEMIEAYFPNLPKIELNRRGPPREGWLAWGFEAGAGAFRGCV